MRTRTGMLAAGTLALLMVAGCGGSNDGAGSGASGTTSVASASAADSSASGGTAASGSASSDAVPMFCDFLTAEQIGEAIGATVTISQGPMDLCEFTQEDPRALGGSVGATRVDIGNGGYEGYAAGARLTLTNPVEVPLSGIGDQAFMTTGTFAGGENLQGAGGVLVGGTVFTVNLTQGNGLSQEQLVQAGTNLLKLLVTTAG